ncbi:MAG: porin family protein [Sulfurovum sp.]|nr:porin family protein [Sulfurovum sp.]
MKKLTLSLVTILATSTFAFAGGDIVPVMEPVIETPMVIEDEEVISDSGVYLGLGYSMLRSTSEYDGLDLANDYHAAMLQGGYKINEYIAVEGRFWYGLATEIDADDAATFDSETMAWGVYAKPMYPVTDELDIYALVGYGSASLNGTKHSNGTTVGDADAAGLSWGIGAAYSFTDNLSVFADYVDFQDDDAVEFDGETTTLNHAFDAINIGVAYKF